VRRIEGLSSGDRSSNCGYDKNTLQTVSIDGGQSACSTLFSTVIPQVNRHCEPKEWQSNISDDRLNFSIPGDISSAAYFIVWGAITGKKLEIENVLLNPARTGFISVLRRMGAEIEVQIKEDIWEPIGDIFVKGGNLKSTDIQADEIPSLIDELPILAVAMAFAKGKSRVSGASELRVKESDRISCLISQLKKAGINCCEYEDGYEICGENKIISTELESFNDHRLAMSFAILSKCSKADIKVKDRDSVRISFPEFYNYLENNN
jgi:3-phosphoshikimate 1-carboxyvinyltransferase